MGIALQKLWLAFATWFTVFNGVANIFLNLTQWGQETSEAFVDEARANRVARNKLLAIELAKDSPDLKAIAAATATTNQG